MQLLNEVFQGLVCVDVGRLVTAAVGIASELTEGFQSGSVFVREKHEGSLNEGNEQQASCDK